MTKIGISTTFFKVLNKKLTKCFIFNIQILPLGHKLVNERSR